MATTSMDEKGVSIRAMRDQDLAEARAIFRIAFGTFIGVPDPEDFAADREYVFTRWRANPGAALVAERSGVLAGSNFAVNWGSFGFFGPLTIRPELWDRASRNTCCGRRWTCLTSGASAKLVSSPSRTVRNISAFTRNSVSGPAFSLL
jgi:hypothetical protein